MATRPKKRPRTPSVSPRGQNLRIYLLDVGSQQYGDCILCELGERRILVDGAHPSDFRGTTGHDSIPAQLETIFGHPAPFPIDLLVATHCHLDHIGCLPDLVASDLKVQYALVADESYGFPSAADFGGDAAVNPAYRLVAALTEENYADGLDDAGINQLLQDAGRLEDRYKTMLQQLDASSKLLRYQGPGTSGLSDLESEFKDFGLKVLGPTLKQLQICRDYLKSAAQDIAGQLKDDAGIFELLLQPALYRSFADLADAAQDRPGPGAAKNDQSIVLKLSSGKHTVLLTGDMQFAEPEVPGLDSEMSELLTNINSEGPYTFIKLAHHGSYNGLNSDVFKSWDKTVSFGCSSGTQDKTHPNSQVLQLLKNDPDKIEWARTDKNGMITVDFDADTPLITVSKGKLNDASPAAGASDTESLSETSAVPVGQLRTLGDGSSQFDATLEIGGAVLSLRLSVPSSSPKTSKLPDQGRTGGGLRNPAPSSVSKTIGSQLAAGRTLPKLLFVTDLAKLAANITPNQATQVAALIRTAGETLLDTSGSQQPQQQVQQALRKTPYDGVVLVGGYDVLPSQTLDVLDPGLRQTLGAQSANDGDNFVVWSDAVYGDVNGDTLEEVPVTRIPDAHSAALLFAALTVDGAGAPPARFGVRNSARPFAAGIYNLLKGTSALNVSAPTSPTTVGPAKILEANVYFMLHGSDVDGTRFWGEQNGQMFLAVNVANVAPAAPSVVFTGCCWGALTVNTIASRVQAGKPILARAVSASMALTFLGAGARAFVGCTGSHYSPLVQPYQFYGGPMHSAFWTRYNASGSPAKALYEAKKDYLAGIPHGRTTDLGQAIELKILREYTCLGLGW